MEVKIHSKTGDKYVIRNPTYANQMSGNVSLSLEEYTQLINEKVLYIIVLREDFAPARVKITDHMIAHVKVYTDYVLVPVFKNSTLYPRSKP